MDHIDVYLESLLDIRNIIVVFVVKWFVIQMKNAVCVPRGSIIDFFRNDNVNKNAFISSSVDICYILYNTYTAFQILMKMVSYCYDYLHVKENIEKRRQSCC